MQSLTDLIALLALVIGIGNLLLGGGVLLPYLKTKPKIRIKRAWLTPLADNRKYIILEIKNEGTISAPNFNMEIEIVGQMTDFETCRIDALQPSKVLPSRTLIQPTIGWLVLSENAYFVNTASQSYHLAVGQIHKIQVRFVYEEGVEKPSYEIVLNAESPEHNIHVKELN